MFSVCGLKVSKKKTRRDLSSCLSKTIKNKVKSWNPSLERKCFNDN